MGGWMERRAGRRTAGCRRPRSLPLQPRLDLLEARELLDGGIALVAGTITITSTAPVNSVMVNYTDPSHSTIAVCWNNTGAFFSSSTVNTIDFESQGSLNVFENLTSISSTAIGGNGTNIFVGESGNDTFIGGSGFNLFIVAAGNNSLVGADGNDTGGRPAPASP
jgi:Ca2+-binding RTX toxin-like protein